MIIQGYNFEGPWSLGTKFNDVPGIYIIFSGQTCLDVGETDKLGARINGDNHERKRDWIKSSFGNRIQVAFLRVLDANKRLVIESYLRNKLYPTCGER